MTELQKKLFALRDGEYLKFNSSLIPGDSIYEMIGVRTPELRKLAKELTKSGEAEDFLRSLPHEYYEENNIHAALLSDMKDSERCLAELERFLPYVDNWATCDTLSPKVFQKHRDGLLPKIRCWIQSKHCYTCRFAVDLLMSFYLEEDFAPEYPELVAGITSEEYYVNMMRAWYFATALAKQYESVLPILRENRLDRWTHNKTIQKAIESRRISDEHKAFLRTLRR